MSKQYCIWIDGQRRYFDYPAEPPGYTPQELVWIECLELIRRLIREDSDVLAKLAEVKT